MKFFAVTGKPIFFSESPLIFNQMFKKELINAIYCRIAAESPSEALFLFRELGLTGMNVTSPFKQKIMKFLDEIDNAAFQIGGVNTIVKHGNILKGYNTDYIGVIKSIKTKGIKIPGKKVLIIGAGGAGRAAAFGLCKEKAKVTIVNRTFRKSVDVANRFGCKAKKIDNLKSLLKHTDIIIYTLPSNTTVIESEWLKKEHVVFDANYQKPSLYQIAKKRGCITIKGEEWLFNQAVPAFSLFINPEYTEAGGTRNQRGSLNMFVNIGIISSQKNKNISLIGFMGTGKSTIGKIVAKKFGLLHRDMDELIEKEENRKISEIFRINGEKYFRKKEKAVLQELKQKEGVVFSCGGGVVLDPLNRKIIKENSTVIWLFSSFDTCTQRLKTSSTSRPLIDFRETETLARDMFKERLIYYAQTSDLIINSEKYGNEVAEKIYEEIYSSISY